MNPLVAATFARLLERATGQELTPARRWRVETLLKPLLRARGLQTLEHLAALLRAPSGRPTRLEDEVVEALLNHETSFFRDAAAFQLLATDVLPALGAARAAARRLRIWSAGCATGQETWSLALALALAPERWSGWTTEILGTDISGAAIARAQAGRFTRFEVERGLPAAHLQAFFDRIGEDWQVRPALRHGLSFRRHNLLDPPPVGPFDLVLCRNVLLYFAPERQRAVLDRLAAAIAPDGYLMLGAGEALCGQSEAFVAAPALRGVYRPAPVQAAR